MDTWLTKVDPHDRHKGSLSACLLMNQQAVRPIHLFRPSQVMTDIRNRQQKTADICRRMRAFQDVFRVRLPAASQVVVLKIRTPEIS